VYLYSGLYCLVFSTCDVIKICAVAMCLFITTRRNISYEFFTGTCVFFFPPTQCITFFCPTIYFVVIAITPEVNYNLLAEGRSFCILRSVKRALTKVARISSSHFYAKFKPKALSGAIFAPESKI